jgi:hypothetical protein
MKLKQFTDAFGRVNLSIVPNGFQEAANCRFSLLMGLNIDRENFGHIDVNNAFELIQEIGIMLNGFLAHMVLKIDHNNPDLKPEDLALSGQFLFNAKHKRRWHRLLSHNDFCIHDQNPAHGAGKAPTFHQKTSQRLAAAVPFFDDNLLNIVSPGLTPSAMISRAFTDRNFAVSIEQMLLNREKMLEDTIFAGQEDGFAYQSSAADARSAGPVKDLMLLINSIYQHPGMARYYGLIYDFDVRPNTQFHKTYFKTAGEKIIYLELRNAPAVMQSNSFNNTLPEIKNIIKVTTAVMNAGDTRKYYHGLPDFGCVRFDPNAFVFTNVSPDRMLQSAKLVSDAINLNTKENNELLQFSKVKRQVTEGIYLIQRPEEGRVHDLGNSADNEIGILGQNIAVRASTDGKNVLRSLCKRKVIYHPAGLSFPFQEEEEGWVQTNIVLSGTNQSYNPQTIFHWTGHNLCVPKMGVHKDQDLNTDEAHQAGGLAGIFSNDENKVIQEHGYTFRLKLSSNTDVLLESGKGYAFIIRQVLSNGYVLPTISDNRYEISLDELTKAGYNYLFDSGIYSVDEDPINSPTLVSENKFDGKGPKTSESASHVVIYRNDQANFRFIFPPVIDIQFAQYLSMFSQVALKAQTPEEYKSRGRHIADRGNYKIPSTSKRSHVEYLPDSRGTMLVITPCNWFTRWFLISQGKPVVAELGNFFNYKGIEHNFPNLQAGMLRTSPSASFNWGFQNGELTYQLTEGVELGFFIQLQDCQNPLSNRFRATQALLGNIKQLVSSLYDQPQYAKGQFQLTRAKQTPDKPVVSNISAVQRPTKLTEINNIFFTFQVINPEPYFYTVDRLQIISKFREMNNDGNELPYAHQVDAGIKRWAAISPLDRLLNNEWPAEAFEQEVCQVESEVYPDQFGFSFNFAGSIADGQFAANEELVCLNAGDNFRFLVVYNAVGTVNYYLNEQLLTAAPLSSNVERTVIFTYSMTDTLHFVVTDTKILLATPSVICIPYPNLSERNLNLAAKVEQTLLTLDATAADSLRFVKSNAFFVYRAEPKPTYLQKELRIQAISRFQNFYPGMDAAQFISEGSEEFTIELANNMPPALPVFNVTPLLFHENIEQQHELRSNRSMQLMFEIDRPLQLNERFSLIIQENKIVSPATCAIGRDLTTYSVQNFADTSAAEGFSLDQFILSDYTLDYLPKYLDRKKASVQLTSLSGTNFSILPLVPYFEKQKNKWIAVIALDQNMIRSFNQKAINAYNPFVKITALIYNAKSSPGNFCSKTSQPKFINLLSERSLKITTNRGKSRFWQVDIENFSQLKFDQHLSKRTSLIVCVRELEMNGIAGGVIKSKDMDGNESYFHLIGSSNAIKIQSIFNKTLAVYEFETFGNLSFSAAQSDLLNNSEARLVYAETFPADFN